MQEQDAFEVIAERQRELALKMTQVRQTLQRVMPKIQSSFDAMSAEQVQLRDEHSRMRKALLSIASLTKGEDGVLESAVQLIACDGLAAVAETHPALRAPLNSSLYPLVGAESN